jgi:signal transduction histidine kinase
MDRGPGVASAHRSKIFEKFHRVDDSLTTAKTGSGLGLSIARRLLRDLGGDLRFESRPGGGSCFVVLMPSVHGL